jgi:hypothetical protein
MRLLKVALAGALLAMPLVAAGSRPANAAMHCTCTDITSGGYCTHYICGPIYELASTGTSTPFRNTKACRRSQALVCDFDSCTLVCDKPK